MAVLGCIIENGWCFFLKVSKEYPTKCLRYGFRQWENWRKRRYFHHAVEMKQPYIIWQSPVLSSQYTGNTGIFSSFSAYGLHAWGLLLVIPLEFQGKKHQTFPMAQPKKKHGRPYIGRIHKGPSVSLCSGITGYKNLFGTMGSPPVFMPYWNMSWRLTRWRLSISICGQGSR